MESNSPGDNSTSDTLDVSKTPRAIFLILFIVISFIGNVFIIIVLAHNVKLRSVQNLLIANMCVTCIIDAFFNMTIITCTLMMKEWIFGIAICKVSNFFMNLVTIKTILTLMAITYDRYCSLRFASKYETWMLPRRIFCIIAYLWMHSLAFSVPFLTGAVNSILGQQLNMCVVIGKTSFIFFIISLLVCFLGPLLITIVIQVFSMKIIYKFRYAKKNELADKNSTQITGEGLQIPVHSSYTIILFILWFILEIPYIVTSYVQQYEYSVKLVSSNVIEYSWQSSATFVWMRFLFSAVFPFITFFCKKEFWQSAKECLLCRRQNSIVDIDAMVISKKGDRRESANKIEKDFCSKTKDKETSDTPSSPNFNVPVLFATSTGICIEDSCTKYNVGESDYIPTTTDTFQLKGKTLDISYSNYEYPDDILDDTSDYDSSCEIDAYSTSQPVSTRNIIGTLHRTRSLSDPEIRSYGKHKIKDKSTDFCVAYIGDSGLDLSVTCGSSLGRTTLKS